jgi:hypothetical protein
MSRSRIPRRRENHDEQRQGSSFPSAFNGSGTGVFYVDPSQALTPEQHLKAVWLEFEVEDEQATAVKLEALGMSPFDYFDLEHKYFQTPDGQVFRLTER